MQSSENGDSPQISKLTTFIKSGLILFLPLLLFTGRELLLRDPIDKPARLIIRLLFGFASDLTNSTNLQILRRQCSLLLPAASITQKVTFKSHIYSITFVAIYVQYSVLTNQRWIMLDTRIRVATPPHFRLNIDTILCLSPPTTSNKLQLFFSSSAVKINATSPITFFLVFSPYLLDFTGKLGQCPLYIFYSYNLGDLALELYLSQCFTSFAARCWVSDSADQWPSLSLPQIALLVFDIFQIHSRHIICLKTISQQRWWSRFSFVDCKQRMGTGQDK